LNILQIRCTKLSFKLGAQGDSLHYELLEKTLRFFITCKRTLQGLNLLLELGVDKFMGKFGICIGECQTLPVLLES